MGWPSFRSLLALARSACKSAEEQNVFIAVTGVVAGVAGCCAAATAGPKATRTKAKEIARTVILQFRGFFQPRGIVSQDRRHGLE
jgi:hypothetical protein